MMWLRGVGSTSWTARFCERRRLPRLHWADRSWGIDRITNSLRQGLWIATDQAFKEAVETYSRKQAYLSSWQGNRTSKISRKRSRCSSSNRCKTQDVDQPQLGPGKRARPRRRCGHFPRFTNRRVTYTSSTRPDICSPAKGTEIARTSFCGDRSRNERPGRRWRPAKSFLCPRTRRRPADLPSVDTCGKD